MKRFVIFALLGPPLGLLIVFLMPSFTHGKPLEFPAPDGMLLLSPFAYLFGVVPALLTAIADWLLAKALPLYARVPTTAAFGYLVTFLTMFLTYNPSKVSLPLVFAYGIVGLVPAAVCSLLSSEKMALSDL
jgi:hypothetical protein